MIQRNPIAIASSRRFDKHCDAVLPDAPTCYLEMLDKLQKQISRTLGSSLAASLDPLAHH